MTTNPDNKDYIGLGPQYKQPGTTLDGRYLVPEKGMLRFVERAVSDPEQERPKLRILQRYEWSSTEGKFDWYDIELVTDE